MSISKKILYIFTAGIFVFLVFCTFLSIYISNKIQPVVEVINPVRMSLKIAGNPENYNTVIPLVAIILGAEDRKYVYVIKQRQGLFGIENYAKLIEVEVIAGDGKYVAIDDLIISNSDDVVLSSSKYITSGEIVKVNIDPYSLTLK